jgi:hypothetical protein
MSDEKDYLAPEDVFWKMKEAEYKCLSISRKIGECDAGVSKLSPDWCDFLRKKYTVCVFTRLSSKLRKCLELTDTDSTWTSPTEASKFSECVEEPGFLDYVDKWSKIVESSEFQDPIAFYPHKNLVDLPEKFTFEEDDDKTQMGVKLRMLQEGKFCLKEQTEAEKCWLKNGDACFKETTKLYNCSISVLCGRHIKMCMEKHKDLGNASYPMCFTGETVPTRIQQCAYQMRHFLETGDQLEEKEEMPELPTGRSKNSL